jgi:tRNA dimethylallyltransferase
MQKKAIIIAGPTGVGKTDLAIELARRLDGELVSCDSVQVYKHLEIGANKERIDGVPQHLIDFVELDESFTAADFYEKCLETIKVN